MEILILRVYVICLLFANKARVTADSDAETRLAAATNVYTIHNNNITFQSPHCFQAPALMDPPPLVVDWSNLPADILTTIQLQLEFPDLFRSAAVCASWRAAAKSLRRHGLYTRPQTPCLLALLHRRR